jgi:hypothetical protein
MCTTDKNGMHMHRIVTSVSALVVLVLTAGQAAAQFPPDQAQPVEPAPGEVYHIEFGTNMWYPTPDMVIASEGLGIIGSQINLQTDLGIVRQRFGELRLVLRPSTKHKFRYNLIPVKYEAESVLSRSIVFNGLRYNIGVPVASTLNWKTHKLGYEYDFLYRPRWFAGFVLDVKVTDVEAELNSVIGTEFARAQAPIPGVGGIGRVYVMPQVAITGELTGFRAPESLRDLGQGHYWDFDLYGTINFSRFFGARVGFRSIDVAYIIDEDTGNLKLKGLYFGGVVRY